MSKRRYVLRITVEQLRGLVAKGYTVSIRHGYRL